MEGCSGATGQLARRGGVIREAGAAGEIHLIGGLVFDPRAKTLGLFTKQLAHFDPPHTFWITGIILDHIGQGSLSADLGACQNKRRYLGSGSIQGSSQSRRTRADDNHFLDLVVLLCFFDLHTRKL